MSIGLEYSLGATAVAIELTMADGNGGVAGEAPTFSVRKASDGYYLDFDDGIFKNGGHTQISQALTDRGDGRYNYVWDSSASVTEAGAYIIEYTNGGLNIPGIDNDVYVFTETASQLATIETQVNNIATSPLASVGDGPGGCKFIYTLTVAGSTERIAGARVHVTTDVTGTNIIAGPSLTDEDGQIEFFLDPGIYHFWRSKGGFQFSNPDTQSF